MFSLTLTGSDHSLPSPALALAPEGVARAIFDIPGGLERKRVSESARRFVRFTVRFVGAESHPAGCELAGSDKKTGRTFQVKGLILAQNERWRRG